MLFLSSVFCLFFLVCVRKWCLNFPLENGEYEAEKRRHAWTGSNLQRKCLCLLWIVMDTWPDDPLGHGDQPKICCSWGVSPEVLISDIHNPRQRNHFMAHNDRCSGLWLGLAKNWFFPGSLYPEANGVHIKVQAEAWCPNSTYILTFSYNCLLRTTTLSTVLVNFLNHHSCRKFDTNAKSQSIGYKLTLLKLTPKKLFLTASCAYLDKARAPRIFFSVLNGIH